MPIPPASQPACLPACKHELQRRVLVVGEVVLKWGLKEGRAGWGGGGSSQAATGGPSQAATGGTSQGA